MKNEKIVFYDGKCSFCQSAFHFLKLRNKKKNLSFHPIESKFSRDFFLDNNVKKIDCSTLYFYDDNQFYVRSRAFFQIFKYLGGIYPILHFISFAFPKVITDYFYKVVARNRYLLGSEESNTHKR